MPSTYSNNLRIQLIAAGEQGNTWGITTNTNLGTLIEDAISGLVNLEPPSADWITNVCTLSVRDGSYDAARNMYLVVPISVTLTNTGQIIAPEVPKVYVISNYSNGGYDVEIKTAASTVTCSVPNGTTKFVVCDGTDFYDAVSATGQLILQDAITDPSQATTKYYVDSGLAGKINLSGNASVPMGGPLILTSAAPSEPYQAVPLTYVDSNCLFSTDTGEQSMQGPLILSESPGVGSGEFQAATKGYVDDNTWTIPVGAATYTNSNVTVDANGHITNIVNGAGGGGGGGIVNSVTISPANGFTQISNTGGSSVTIALGVNGAAAADKVLFGTSSGVMRAATAAEIVSGIGSTAVANATNATNSTQLNSQNASYYANSNPIWLTALSPSSISAVGVTNGYVLTANSGSANWAANGGGGGGGVSSVSGTSGNGFNINVSSPTTTPNITVSTSLSGVLAGTGSGMTTASSGNITAALGYTPPSTTGSGASGTWGINISGSAASASSLAAGTYGINITGSAGSITNGVYTVGNQTIGGIKYFSERVLLSNDGFMFGNAGEGGADTGIYWGGDGVMNVMCNAQVVGQFTNSGYTGNITGNAATATNASYANNAGYASNANIAYYSNAVYWSVQGTGWGVGFGAGGSGNFVPSPDNTFSCGSASNRFNAIYATSGFVNTSDERQKTAIAASDLGLGFINTLTPRSYKWINRQNVIDEETQELVPTPGVRTHYGLIAQEVETALNGKDFAGLVYDEEADVYGLRYEQFISPLIKAVQELSAKVDSLTSELNALKGN